MDIAASVALAAGAAWASGINVYAVILVLGILGSTGSMVLPPDLQILTDPLVITAAGFMYCVEFFADKTPGVDTAWDGLHTFVRIPAGAVLAAATLGQMDPAIQIAAFILGGGLAAASHATKAATRVMINTSPEPLSNWAASISEDLLVVGGLWAALHHPALFLIALTITVGCMLWLLPRLWRGIKHVFGAAKRLFRRDARHESPSGISEQPKALGHSSARNS